MINGKAPEGYSHLNISTKASTDFYGVASQTLSEVYRGAKLSGLVLMIQNKMKEPLTLSPSTFYYRGIRAIALSQQTIPPRGTGLVYEVTSNEV